MKNKDDGKRSWGIMDDPIKTAISIFFITILLVFSITAGWDWISSTIMPNTRLGLYSAEFWENVLVEMHGMTVELAVVGILLLWLDGRRDKKKNLAQCRQDLKSYANMDFPESHLKKINAIKILINAQERGLDARYLHLAGRALSEINIVEWNLIGLKLNGGKLESSHFSSVNARSCNFVQSTLRDVIFERGSLYRCKFEGASLRQVKFRSVNIENVEFTHCDMPNTVFEDVSMIGVKFDGATLDRCSFKSARDVDFSELARAKSLDYLAVSDDVLKQLIMLRSDMKYQKKRLRP